MTNFRRFSAPRWCAVAILFTLVLAAPSLRAAEPPSNVAPLLRLLKQGTLPTARLPAVVKLVCERGNADDLAFILSEVAAAHWPANVERDALDWLHEAAITRKLVPAGDLAPALDALLSDTSDPEQLRRAVRLAGAWRSPAAIAPLERLAHDPQMSPALRREAHAALIGFGGEVARRTIDALLQPGQPLDLRLQAVSGLAPLEGPRAAAAAAAILEELGPTDDPAPIIDAFLNLRGGADLLAAAIEKSPPSSDVALLALRHMYAVGRSDLALDRLLSRLAGIHAEAPRLTPEEIQQLAREAEQQGDPARGEAVFRRGDLACMRCHAVSGAGGQVGPDLCPVGATSPVDYLVKSIYDPDAQKKEAYLTRIVLTSDGQQLTGIVVDRTDDKLTLKLADGKLAEIPSADIEFESEGKSLMPEGLVKFMTRQEVLDLVKFLSQLGKPGTPYAIRTGQRMQRWRVLTGGPDLLQSTIPNDEVFGEVVLDHGSWMPVYARVNGDLPLADLTALTHAPIVYVQGEINVTKAGPLEIELNDWSGLQIWVDGDSYDPQPGLTVTLPAGLHPITLRIDTAARTADAVRLQLARPRDAATQATVVDGA